MNLRHNKPMNMNVFFNSNNKFLLEKEMKLIASMLCRCDIILKDFSHLFLC